MIEKTALVINKYAETFHKEVAEHINQFQSDRLTVDVQYSPMTNGMGEAAHSAFIIGRSNVNV